MWQKYLDKTYSFYWKLKSIKTSWSSWVLEKTFSPISGGGLNRLTARQGLAFEDFCWQTQVLVLLIYMCRRVWGMIPQDGSSKNVLRCPEDFFFQVFCGLRGAHTVSLFQRWLCFSFAPSTSHSPTPNTAFFDLQYIFCSDGRNRTWGPRMQ